MTAPHTSSAVESLVGWFASMGGVTQVAALLVLFLSVWCSYHSLFHPLANYPGPLSARLGLPIWLFWHTYKREYVWSLEALHDRHGVVVRIGPNHLSFASPAAMSAIYAHGSAFQKSTFYHSFQVYSQHPSIFSDTDPKSHADRRRSVSAAYSMSSLVGLEPCVEPLVDELVKELRTRCRAGGLNLSRWMHFFAMDAVGELAFGQSFGFVRQGADESKFLQGVSNLSHWGSMAGTIPALSKPLRLLLHYMSGEAGGDVVDHLTRPLIDARFKAIEEKKAKGQGEEDEIRDDLLSKFIKSKDPRTGGTLKPLQVLTTAISVVGAGSDTTSVALTAFLGYLVRHPSIYTAVQEEIDEAFESGQLCFPVTYAMGVKLEWLQACLKETLRLHPPIAMSLPRVAPPIGAMIDGHFVPSSTQVSVSPYVLHRSRLAYGDDARSYNPSRWLHLSDAERRQLEKSNLTFGAGSRQCLGKNISLMELSKVLPSLLRSFSFAIPADTSRGRDSDGKWVDSAPWNCSSTWFLDAQNLLLDVTEREVDDG